MSRSRVLPTPPALTGRSILKFLYMNDGQSPQEGLTAALSADAQVVDRLVQSLSAARLLERRNGCLVLSEAGRRWCGSELKTAPVMPPPSASAPPSVPAPQPARPASSPPPPKVSLPPRAAGAAAAVTSRPVLTVSRATTPVAAPLPVPPPVPPVVSRATPQEAAPVAVPPPVPPPVAPVPPRAAAPVAAPSPVAPVPPRAAAPVAEPSPVLSDEAKAVPPAATPRKRKVAVDDDGFVTHINGKKIF